MKVTTIKEVNDNVTLKLDELFGSLRTFELTLSDNDSRRSKSVALLFACDEDI